MNNTKLTPGNIVIMVGGVLAIIGSFLAFYTFSFAGFSKSFSSWSNHFFIIATLPALLALAMGIVAGVESFAHGVSVPPRVLGFSINQVHLVLGVQATILMVAWLLVDYGFDKGIGMYLMLFGAIACLVGAIMRNASRSSSPPLPPSY